MSRDTTVIAFRQPEAIDDPLSDPWVIIHHNRPPVGAAAIAHLPQLGRFEVPIAGQR